MTEGAFSYFFFYTGETLKIISFVFPKTLLCSTYIFIPAHSMLMMFCTTLSSFLALTLSEPLGAPPGGVPVPKPNVGAGVAAFGVERKDK